MPEALSVLGPQKGCLVDQHIRVLNECRVEPRACIPSESKDDMLVPFHDLFAACFQSNDLGRGTVAVFGLQTRTRFEEPITTRGYVVPSGERLHGPSPHRESFPVADR